MITAFKWGVMYAQLEDGDVILRDPVHLGDHIITPGTQITRIGSKNRSMFAMKDGYWLEYVGKVGAYILFNSRPTGCTGEPWYYAFAHVSPTTLLCINAENGSGWDIRVDEIVFRVAE